MQLSNHDVARVFAEIAELLAIRGGDRHRVRSFHRTARIVENLPEPIDRMLRYGTLQKTPGVGDGTMQRVKEILRRGTCADLEKLRNQLPQGLREMMKIKGLGANTVRQVYQRFGVADVDALEAAARSGLLAQLPRFGVDRIHAILREIEAHKRRRGKIPLLEALTITNRLAEALRDVPGVTAACAGGSVRRWKALIGDLDMLVAAADPKPVVERFLHAPDVETILATKAEGGSVRLHSGRQADLWVFPPECWGAGLAAFSGSKEHVVAVRQRAGRMGLHLSEHGAFTREDRALRSRVTPGTREEDIYAAVGLPWIAPVLRQNLGEIEAADAGRLPRIVTADDLRGDLHLHTTASDGSGTIAQMARAAIDLGYEYLSITDHSKSLKVANGLDEQRLIEHAARIRKVEQDLGRLALLPGVEVDILADGSLDIEASVLRDLDWVVASVHEHFDMDAETMTERFIRAMETGLVDCLGHPTGRKLGRRDAYPLDLDRLLEAARRLGVAVEIDGDPFRMDLDEVGARVARELGVEIVLNTDAHSPAHLARREFAVAVAQRAWLEPKHILNTRPVEALREHRSQRLRSRGIIVQVRESLKIVESETTAEEQDARSDLVERLRMRPLDPELRVRIETFLRESDDAELEAALVAEGAANPVQTAFNLLMGG